MSPRALLLALPVLFLACGSEGGGSPKASSSAGAAATAKPLDLEDVKNEKRKFSFKGPKGIKADASGDSYQWDTMQIMVEQPEAALEKNEDLMKVVVGSGKDGATLENGAEGAVLVTSWKQKDGPAHMVCGQKGKTVALRIMHEPDHKAQASAICKSLKVD